jgi:hypothetical protein
MKRERFEQIVNSVPDLVDQGIANKLFCRQFNLEYPHSKAVLISDEGFEAFIRCIEWLRANCIPTKTITTHAPSSRTLQQIAKHPVYVSNGAMIAAIIYLGFPYKIRDDSPNILVGVDRRSPCFKNGSPP